MPGVDVPVATERTEIGPSPLGLMRTSRDLAAIRIEVSFGDAARVGTSLVSPSTLTSAVPRPGPAKNVTSSQSKAVCAAVNRIQASFEAEVILAPVMPKGPGTFVAAL